MSVEYNPDLPLQFLHIPKTGGTSVGGMIARSFPQRLICPAGHWDYIVRLPEEQLLGFQVFLGHYSACLSRFLDKPLNVFTFLRDPVERTLSHYGFIRTDRTHPFFEAARTRTLLEFVRDPLTRPNIENYQARYVADLGLDPSAIAPVFAGRDPARFELHMHIDEQSLKVPAGKLYEQAMQSLNSFFFVGTTENLDGSVRRLSALIGVDLGPPLHANVTEHRITQDQLDRETLRAIREATEIDFALYERARMLESAKWAAD